MFYAASLLQIAARFVDFQYLLVVHSGVKACLRCAVLRDRLNVWNGTLLKDALYWTSGG
jgi:hypothetical protein